MKFSKSKIAFFLALFASQPLVAQLSLKDSYASRGFDADYTAPRTDLLRSSIGDFIYGPESKLEFKIIEDESGVRTTYYKIGALPYVQHKSGHLVPARIEDGNYRILYYSVDQSGNQEQLRFDEIAVDKTGPEILSAFSELPKSYTPHGLPIYSSDTRLTIQVIDEHVGLQKVVYQINDLNPVEVEKSTIDLQDELQNLEESTVKVRLFAQDMLGNESLEWISFKINR